MKSDGRYVRETKHFRGTFGLRICSGGNFLDFSAAIFSLQDPQSSRAPYVQRSAKPGKLPAEPTKLGSWVGIGKVLDRFLLDVRGYSLEALMILLVWLSFFLQLSAIILEVNAQEDFDRIRVVDEDVTPQAEFGE